MNAAQKRAFTQRWLASREILFSADDGEEEPPSRRLVSTVVFKWEIRPARDDDLAGLFKLEHQCFSSDQISRHEFQKFILSSEATVLAIEADGEISGAAVVVFRQDYAWLYSLAVASQFRGRGWAIRLLGAAEHEARRRGCRSMRLEVRPDNHAAIRLYRRAGFYDHGRVACFYADGSDALLFERALPALSRRLANYSGHNLILDGRVRIAPEPRYRARYVVEAKLWALWGYRWSGLSGTWGDLQLFHCKRFEMEDEPI